MIVFQSPRQPRPRWAVIAYVVVMVLAIGAGVGGLLIGVASACNSWTGKTDSLLNQIGLGSGVETRSIGGDARAFDPIGELERAREFAGEGSRLVSMDIDLVRADGTMDLKASYSPKPATSYRFAREVPRPDDAPPPGAGGANTGTWYEVVEIQVYEPGQRRRITTVGGGVGKTADYVNKGMQRNPIDPSTTKPVFIETSLCTPKQLWDVALAKGAPADGVARIDYEAKSISFSITGVTNLSFKPDCTVSTR